MCVASFVGPRIWDTIPKVCQNTNWLLFFKENIKKWFLKTALVEFAKILKQAKIILIFKKGDQQDCNNNLSHSYKILVKLLKNSFTGSFTDFLNLIILPQSPLN